MVSRSCLDREIRVLLARHTRRKGGLLGIQRCCRQLMIPLAYIVGLWGHTDEASCPVSFLALTKAGGNSIGKRQRYPECIGLQYQY